MPGPRTCTRVFKLFASVFVLALVVTDVYNYVPEGLRKVLFSDFHSKRPRKTGNISERLGRFIPWLSRKLDYSEQLARLGAS